MNVVVYDTGMLMALVGQDRRAHVLHKGFVAARGHKPIIPGPALSQAWRTSPKTAYAWKRLLADVVVYPVARARNLDNVPRCLPCASGVDTEGWKTLGDMIGAAALPPKKRPDPVDALAVLIAAGHGGGSILTSDRDDIQAYAATLPGSGVSAVAV
ncbi:hypothetical protein F9278_22205 [Streptomyces phaeolivaceus]|uniref:PIN domain-containing protein n=1 Tax=Streptomyces phaeolivaceus TaxID=2653200 RepID=A0A5P8K6M8_9ACTN|nr:hypothetical protein [Streptomyces phaeolivaceus]QFQ98448.1 hypothetical protein F9278_22205 [Streptomyces phaeolivaceus]